MDEEYIKMLDDALEQIPKNVFESSRFQIPESEVTNVGNRTIVHNFKAIATALNRDPNHLIKYLLREMGAAGDLKGAQANFQGKFTKSVIDERIRKYAEEFVLCRECGKPDTRIDRVDRVYIIRCEACGARTSARGI
ncbi:MAG: translation initiation factor IF-2 subunit beta [Candidatus Hadarchaeales archaeon]